MNVMLILAMLVNSGICAKVDFKGPDGKTLSVIVCPMMQQAEPEGDPA